mmetsp:Transcript_15445/g.38894  ORF Transcript_15445/g.38894 Transcript_15445/m.38894 type:complete len:208 (-) Transcript_15445:606-1229(-)
MLRCAAQRKDCWSDGWGWSTYGRRRGGGASVASGVVSAQASSSSPHATLYADLAPCGLRAPACPKLSGTKRPELACGPSKAATSAAPAPGTRRCLTKKGSSSSSLSEESRPASTCSSAAPLDQIEMPGRALSSDEESERVGCSLCALWLCSLSSRDCTTGSTKSVPWALSCSPKEEGSGSSRACFSCTSSESSCACTSGTQARTASL